MLSFAKAHAVFARFCGQNSLIIRREDAEIAARSGQCYKTRVDYAHTAFARLCASNCNMRRTAAAELACISRMSQTAKVANAQAVLDISCDPAHNI